MHSGRKKILTINKSLKIVTVFTDSKFMNKKKERDKK